MRKGHLFFAAALTAACSAPLPDQDRRIYAAVPVAKMSVADLWKDFKDDSADASKRYVGKAVEISGSLRNQAGDKPSASPILFKQEGDLGVQANLLDDEAAGLIKVAGEGERLTMHCFCAGQAGGHVVLKSCVPVTR